jgi:carboxyl-terminal processing protease
MPAPKTIILFFLLHIVCGSVYADQNKTEARLPLEELRYFTQAFERIRREHIDKIDDKKLLEMSIEGLLNSLDPHSAYLNKKAFSLLQEHSSGEFGGLGIQINLEKDFIRVISPIDDSPAYKAGILPGDLIIKLNDSSIKSMTTNEAIELMRGPKGSMLTLTIMREQIDAPIEIKVIRDTITADSVRSEILRPGFGYIRITQFQKNTGIQFKEALQSLFANKGDQKGIIIDLRNNPGGLLTASIEVVDTVLDGGLIVYTEGRAPKSNLKYYASKGDMLDGLPIVVLVNEGSASAAEIVAGALQDHRRALVLGTNSFGKGSVQTVFPLGDDRGIKLTTARYFTPNKVSIQALGIKPDITVESAEIKIRKKLAPTREANLLGHLSSSLDQEKIIKNKPVIDDNQLHDALNLLQGLSLLNSKLKP